MSTRILDENTIQNPNDINVITEIYTSDKNLSSGEILRIFQERVAHKAASHEIQLIHEEHENLTEVSFLYKQEKLEQLLAESKAHLSSSRSISDTNPSDFYLINKLHQELKFSNEQLKHYQKLIARVKGVESAFKSGLGTSFRFSGNKPCQEEFQKLVEESLDEIGTKELLEFLEQGKNEWQEEVNHLNHQIDLKGLPLATPYAQSNLEDYLIQYDNHNHSSTKSKGAIKHDSN